MWHNLWTHSPTVFKLDGYVVDGVYWELRWLEGQRSSAVDASVRMCSSEKRFKMDNDDVVVTIESRLKLMTQKMSQLVNSWNEQTRGLHLDSDGQLCGLFASLSTFWFAQNEPKSLPPDMFHWLIVYLLNRFRTEQAHCGACRRKWRLTDTDLCPCGETQTMSHIVESCPRQNWMVAYLSYTLWMNMLFHGWPVMAHEMHMRRR